MAELKIEKLFMQDQPVTKEEAESAIKTLLKWIGENPEREGLKETPKRVVKSFEEFFAGYKQDPKKVLNKTFEEVESYSDAIVLRDIRLESHCEHHMLPIIGKVNIAYVPNKKVVGISKLARVVDILAKRLQIQEKLTAQIADTIFNTLECKGVGVTIQAQHHCMTIRGTHKENSLMLTSHFLGCFKDDYSLKQLVAF
jgi:GTP cyclohydrolase I